MLVYQVSHYEAQHVKLAAELEAADTRREALRRARKDLDAHVSEVHAARSSMTAWIARQGQKGLANQAPSIKTDTTTSTTTTTTTTTTKTGKQSMSKQSLTP